MAVDGELSPREKEELKRHVAICPDCAKERAEVRALRSVMPVWTDEEPSPWLAQNFSYRLRQEMSKPTPVPVQPKRAWWLPGTAIAAVAAVLVGITLLAHNPTAPKPTTVALGPAHIQPVEVAPKPESEPAVEKPATVAAPIHHHRIAHKYAQPRLVASLPDTKPVPEPSLAAADLIGPVQPEKPIDMTAPSPKRPVADEAKEIATKMVVAQATQGNATDKVASSLGEAGLTMNETMERLRGSLQKAVDALHSQSKSSEQSEPLGSKTL